MCSDVNAVKDSWFIQQWKDSEAKNPELPNWKRSMQIAEEAHSADFTGFCTRKKAKLEEAREAVMKTEAELVKAMSHARSLLEE